MEEDLKEIKNDIKELKKINSKILEVLVFQDSRYKTIKIDGTKVVEQIVPSTIKTLKETETINF